MVGLFKLKKKKKNKKLYELLDFFLNYLAFLKILGARSKPAQQAVPSSENKTEDNCHYFFIFPIFNLHIA